MTHGNPLNMWQFETGARRDDQGEKPRFDLITPFGLERLAQVYTDGAKHYGDRNWEKGIPISRMFASLERHIQAFKRGDREEDHLAQAVWNAMGIMHFEEMIFRGMLPDSFNDLPKYWPADKIADEQPEKAVADAASPCPAADGPIDLTKVPLLTPIPDGPLSDFIYGPGGGPVKKAVGQINDLRTHIADLHAVLTTLQEYDTPSNGVNCGDPSCACDPASGAVWVSQPMLKRYKKRDGYDGDWNTLPGDPGHWRIDGDTVTFITPSGKVRPSQTPMAQAIRYIDSGEWVRNDEPQDRDHPCDEPEEPTNFQKRSQFQNFLIDQGCEPHVALSIVEGITFAYSKPSLDISVETVYIAGPMRGYKDFNFPAFDRLRDDLIIDGIDVISPADIDRVSGTASKLQEPSTYIIRDMYALILLASLDGSVVFLPGWTESMGAQAEYRLARWLGLTCRDAGGNDIDVNF